MLLPEHFASEVNAAVFAEISKQLLAGKPCDVVTVGVALNGLVDMATLNQMAQYVPSASNAYIHARTIVERHKARKLAEIGGRIAELAHDTTMPIDQRFEAAQGMFQVLADASSTDGGAFWTPIEESLERALALVQQRADGIDDFKPTGLSQLDDMLDGGFRPGELITIGARPRMGKSALSGNIALNVSRQFVTGTINLEMTGDQSTLRAIANLGSVPLGDMRRPNQGYGLDWDRFTAGIEEARMRKLFQHNRSGVTVQQICTRARELKRKHGLEILVVDYVGLVKPSSSVIQRHLQVKEITSGLKRLAIELGIVVIALAQLNREVEKRSRDQQRPTLADMGESASIEQDSDIILAIHRPKLVDDTLGANFDEFAELCVLKQRDGRTGVIPLRYVGQFTRFEDWSGSIPVAPTKALQTSVSRMPSNY